MKKVTALMLSAIVLFTSACSMSNYPSGDKQLNYDRLETLTQATTLIVFSRSENKVQVDSLCTSFAVIGSVLENYNDPDATFDKLRTLVVSTVNNIPAEKLNNTAKKAVLEIVNMVLDDVFTYTKDNYAQLIQQDSISVILNVSRSVSKGLNQACLELSN